MFERKEFVIMILAAVAIIAAALALRLYSDHIKRAATVAGEEFEEEEEPPPPPYIPPPVRKIPPNAKISFSIVEPRPEGNKIREATPGEEVSSNNLLEISCAGEGRKMAFLYRREGEKIYRVLPFGADEYAPLKTFHNPKDDSIGFLVSLNLLKGKQKFIVVLSDGPILLTTLDAAVQTLPSYVGRLNFTLEGVLGIAFEINIKEN